MDSSARRFDRFLARLGPPPWQIVLAVSFSLLLAGVLLFLPEAAARHDLDSLAFGISICWFPVGILAAVVSALLAGAAAQRAWHCLCVSVLAGLMALLLMSNLLVRRQTAEERSFLLLVCLPFVVLPLIPAALSLWRLWKDTS